MRMIDSVERSAARSLEPKALNSYKTKKKRLEERKDGGNWIKEEKGAKRDSVQKRSGLWQTRKEM